LKAIGSRVIDLRLRELARAWRTVSLEYLAAWVKVMRCQPVVKTRPSFGLLKYLKKKMFNISFKNKIIDVDGGK
jgi:hypothetical protein